MIFISRLRERKRLYLWQRERKGERAVTREIAMRTRDKLDFPKIELQIDSWRVRVVTLEMKEATIY